jgi:hypothetical protein
VHYEFYFSLTPPQTNAGPDKRWPPHPWWFFVRLGPKQDVLLLGYLLPTAVSFASQIIKTVPELRGHTFTLFFLFSRRENRRYGFKSNNQ